MYKQGIEVRRKTDVGIIIEKTSWLKLFESLFRETERIYYPNDQDDVLYLNIKGVTIAVISGQGSSMAACMTERLRVYGAKAIIRIGTCGALSKKIKLWKPIITLASMSHEGTSKHYLPDGYPIISDFDLSNQLILEFKKQKIDCQKGITITTDGRWRENPESLKSLNQLGVVSIEMETAAILSVCQYRKLPAAIVNIPVDLPADGKNTNDFKGIPNRKTYTIDLENCLKQTIPPVVNALTEFFKKKKWQNG